MKVKEVIKLAEECGYVYCRTKGDHRIYKKDGFQNLVIPGKLSDDIPKGTEKSILRAMNKKN